MKETDNYDVIMQSIQRKQRRSGILYALIPLILVLAGMAYYLKEIDHKTQELKLARLAAKKEADSLDRQISLKRKALLDTVKILKSTQEELVMLNNELRMAKLSFAKGRARQTDSTLYLIQNQVKQAEKELNVVIRQQNRNDHLEGVRIEYYERDADAGLVTESLRKLGFTNVEIKASKVKYDLQPSNYIYYGSQVDVQQVKLISLAMLGNGFDIKEIRPFQQDLNPRVIQIGRKSSIFKQRSITPDDVNKLN